MNEDVYEETRELDKEFLNKAKEMSEKGQHTTVFHNNIVV